MFKKTEPKKYVDPQIIVAREYANKAVKLAVAYTALYVVAFGISRTISAVNENLENKEK